MIRRGLLLIVLTLCLAAPASALAAQRYAAPTPQGMGDCSSPANACDIVSAINSAGSGDEVIVAGNAGTYGTRTSPITTSLLGASNVNIHGAAGQPRPVIYSSAGYAVEAVTGDSVSDLTIVDSSSTALETAVPTDHVLAISTASGGTGCSVFAGATVTNTVCSGPGYGVVSGSGCGGACSYTDTLRDDTIIGGSVGLMVEIGSYDAETLSLTNTIVRGSGTDVETNTTGGVSATVTADHSNYATVDTSNGGTVTPAGSGTNQTAAPLFVSAAAYNYHEAAGSPTIDAGVNSPLNGTTDLDGNPRTVGASTDIGAYEYIPPHVPPPPTPPAISHLQFNHSKFKLGRHHKKPKISYTASEASTVTFSVYRVRHGKRKLSGTFTRSASAGSNSFKWSGKLKGKRLKKGKYVLVAVPAVGALKGSKVSVSFTVK